MVVARIPVILHHALCYNHVFLGFQVIVLASRPLRVFIFGDQAGIRDWRAMMRTVKSATPHVMHRLRFDYIDIFQHPRSLPAALNMIKHY